MNDIRLVNVSKSFGTESVLKNYNLTVEEGCFFALLGPSGCGKTTVLRLLAGFEQVDGGEIYLGNKNITYLPANERSVNTVFQSYALFPHLNIFDNVAYGLRIKNVAKSEIQDRVMKVLHAVHLEKQVYKSISQLSGGQQQRVALARAIVNDPDVLLLDEPLAALDLKLRERMLVELIDLQEKLRTTFIYITHDQDEALAVADRMAIMNSNGQIEQIGDPGAIYDQPKTSFVAKFVGTTNLLSGTLKMKGEDMVVPLDGAGTELKIAVGKISSELVGNRFKFSLRPEKIALTKKTNLLDGYDHNITGEVVSVIYHGKSTLYRVHVSNGYVMEVFDQNCSRNDANEAEVGDTVYLHWRSGDVVLLVN